MTPQDHWNLIASDPRYRSDSARGHDFRDLPLERSHWPVLAVCVALALIAGGFFFMMKGVL